MPIEVSGIQIGVLEGGPVSIALSQLSDVNISGPVAGQYLRYEPAIQKWQNSYITNDLFTHMTGAGGITLNYDSGTDRIVIGLTFSASGDATGTTSNGTLPLTLATVNTTPGVFGTSTAIPVITVNGKGLVTLITTTAFAGTAPLATSLAGGTIGSLPYQSSPGVTAFLPAGTTSQALISGPSGPTWSSTLSGLTAVTATSFTGALTGAASLNVLKTGDTMTGLLLLSGDPVQALGAVTKQYVDNVAAGLKAKTSSVTATVAPLATSSAGTITYSNGNAGVGATLTTTGNFNNIGGVSTTDGSRILVKDEAAQATNGIYVRTSPTVLTRASDFDNSIPDEVASGDFTFISSGNLAGTNWVLTSSTAISIGSTPLVFTQLSGPGTYTAGTGIAINSNQISNTGVLSITGTANQITASAAVGAITLSLPSAVTISGLMTAGSFTGAGTGLTGSGASFNAGTATKLETARTINGVSFDGTANIIITSNTTAALTMNNGGAGAASGTTFNGSTAQTISYNTVGAPSTTGTNASGTWPISITGNSVTVGGFAPSQTNGVASRVVVADINGYISNNYFNSTDNSVASGVTAVLVKAGDDYHRSGTPQSVATFLNGTSLNISGTSTFSTSSLQNGSPGADWNVYFNGTNAGAQRWGESSSGGPAGTWWFVNNYRHSNASNSWGVQQAYGWEDNINEFYTRRVSAGTFSAWARFLNSSNYNSYAPTLTGGNASGTWAIGISGTATYSQYLWSTSHSGTYYVSNAWDGTYWRFSSNHGSPVAVGYADSAGSAGSATNAGNADTVDGYHASTTQSVNTAVVRDASGYIFTSYINSSTGNGENPSISQVVVTNGSDNYYRKASIAHLTASLSGTAPINISGNAATATTAGSASTAGSATNAGNADTVDGYHASIANSANTAVVRGGSGEISVGSISSTGNITASGDVIASSDIRIKKNIEVIPDALGKVLQIRGVTFNRTNIGDDLKRHSGVIAQEVEKVLPEVISEVNDGIKSVAYGNMVGLLIEAIKELNAKVETLKNEIRTLRS